MIKIALRSLIVLAVFGLMFPQMATAATPIAVIDLARILDDSSAGKDLKAKFTAKRDAIQKEALAYDKDLREKEQVLIKDKKILSDKEFAEKRGTFEKDIKKKREDVLAKNAALEKSKNEALMTIRTKIIQICEGLAKEKEIQMILDRTAVVITQQSLNITDDVISKLNDDLKSVSLK